MKLSKLIERLLIIQDNVDPETEVLLVEQGIVYGAMQTYVRLVEEMDIQFEELTNKSIIIDSPIEKGVVIGFLPKYEEKKDTQQDRIPV